MQSRIHRHHHALYSSSRSSPMNRLSPRPESFPGWAASIQMTTHTQFAGGRRTLRRAQARGGGRGRFLMTEYRAIRAPRASLPSPPKLPGHIVPVEVSPGHEVPDSSPRDFYAGTPQIQIGLAFSNRSARAFSAAAASSCQHVSGQGTFWLELSGELVMRDLQPWRDFARASRTRGRVPVRSVSFQITTVPGIKNLIFGGDGIFLVPLYARSMNSDNRTPGPRKKLGPCWSYQRACGRRKAPPCMFIPTLRAPHAGSRATN